MWRVMRHERTIGALTLDGSGGREHHKVESFGAGDGTKRDGGGGDVEGKTQTGINYGG
jgi:hypothetical protein